MNNSPSLTVMPQTLVGVPPLEKTFTAAASATDSSDVNPFSIACVTFLGVSQLMQEILSLAYNAMQKASDRARATKDMANRMDKVIADVSKKDEKGTEPVPKEVRDYMRANGILVEGKTIDEYMGGDQNKKLDKGQLTSIQASLENSFNADTDLLKQKQIMFDKYNNTYNAMLEGAKSLIDKWGRLLNDIVRG